MVSSHPYKSGNYAPVKYPNNLLQVSNYIGKIPIELAGGMYIRNGSNPSGVQPTTGIEPSYHWVR